VHCKAGQSRSPASHWAYASCSPGKPGTQWRTLSGSPLKLRAPSPPHTHAASSIGTSSYLRANELSREPGSWTVARDLYLTIDRRRSAFRSGMGTHRSCISANREVSRSGFGREPGARRRCTSQGAEAQSRLVNRASSACAARCRPRARRRGVATLDRTGTGSLRRSDLRRARPHVPGLRVNGRFARGARTRTANRSRNRHGRHAHVLVAPPLGGCLGIVRR
jgi:hypothetical protein